MSLSGAPAPAGPMEPEEQRPAPTAPAKETPVPGGAREVEGSEERSARRKRGGITHWFEKRAHRVASKIYAARADELEERARRVVGSAYREHSDDLEDRAVRALRKAIVHEADVIKDAIEHGVQVKKREVRLSLLVLLVASLVYLGLYWFTQEPVQFGRPGATQSTETAPAVDPSQPPD